MTLSEAISWCSAASGAAAGISVLTLVEAAVSTGAAVEAGTAATAPGALTVMILLLLSLSSGKCAYRPDPI